MKSAPNTLNQARRYHSERELLESLQIGPEHVLDALKLPPRARDLVAARYALGEGLYPATREVVLGAILDLSSEAITLRPSFWESTSSFNYQRYLLERRPLLECQVRADAARPFGISAPFPARFTEVPSVFLGRRQEIGSDGMLVMQLGDSEMNEVRRDLRPGLTHIVPNAFASLKFSYTTSGEVVIITCASRIHERLESEELRERYQDWRLMMLQALEFMLRFRGDNVMPAPLGHVESKEILPTKIVIHPLELDKKRIRDVANALWEETFREPHPAIGKDVEIVEEQAEELLKLTECARARAGFIEEWSQTGRGADRGFQNKLLSRLVSPHRLVKVIPPLSRASFKDSDSELLNIFEMVRYEDGHSLFQRLDTVLHPALFESLDSGLSVSAAHPLRPRGFSSPSMRGVAHHFELAPGEPFAVDAVLHHASARARDQYVNDLKSRDAQFATEIVGLDFVPISKAVVTGGQQEWWRIPKGDRTHCSTTHLADQNRHPCIRVILSEAEAKRRGLPRRLVIGVKGGGHCSQGLAKLDPVPEDVQLPIRLNIAQDPPAPDEPGGKYPAPFPSRWGGSESEGSVRELSFTAEFRSFLDETAPDLLSLVPKPLNALRLLAVPVWREGVVDWVSAPEYVRKYFRGASLNQVELGAYLSLQSCDVRLRQLYQRVFVREGKSIRDYRVAGKEVASALSALFYWNDEDPTVQVESDIARLPSLTVAELLQCLAREYHRNPERAERVFARTAGRLAGLVGHVHGFGGHFGGGYRRLDEEKTIGICWGGPLGMRNIDLTGGLHDFDMPDMYFPWLGKELGDPEERVLQRDQLARSRAYDLMYLSEAVGWFEAILRGRTDPQLHAEPTAILRDGPFNDITILNEREEDGQAEVLRKYWIPTVLKTGFSSETTSPGGLLGDDIWGFYFERFDAAERLRQAAQPERW